MRSVNSTKERSAVNFWSFYLCLTWWKIQTVLLQIQVGCFSSELHNSKKTKRYPLNHWKIRVNSPPNLFAASLQFSDYSWGLLVLQLCSMLLNSDWGKIHLLLLCLSQSPFEKISEQKILHEFVIARFLPIQKSTVAAQKIKKKGCCKLWFRDCGQASKTVKN